MSNLNKKCIKKLNISFDNLDITQPYIISILSAIIAAVGLTTDNESVIIASMILSPIGAIVIKGTLSNFLANKNKREPAYKWLFIFFIIIIISIIIGFIWGLFFAFFVNPISGKRIIYNREYPTKEMKSRAEIDNAIFMIPIALVGGLVLPSAIHHNNIIRIVAISIAVALLPPLVNIGISLSTFFNDDIYDPVFIKNSLITGSSIFLINVILIWLPSTLWFKYLCYNNKYSNFFKNIMNIIK